MKTWLTLMPVRWPPVLGPLLTRRQAERRRCFCRKVRLAAWQEIPGCRLVNALNVRVLESYRHHDRPWEWRQAEHAAHACTPGARL